MAVDRAVIEIASDRGEAIDSLPERSRPFSTDGRNSLCLDGRGKRMQLDVRTLAIPDVKLIRT